jgi:hypothetical protein
MKGRDECGEAQRGIQMEVEGGGRDDVEALAASGELPNTNGGGRGGWRGAEFRKVRFPGKSEDISVSESPPRLPLQPQSHNNKQIF